MSRKLQFPKIPVIKSGEDRPRPQSTALRKELLEYKPQDIIDVCVNVHYDEEVVNVCNDKGFWKEKIVKDFGRDFPDLSDLDFVPEEDWRDEYYYYYHLLQYQLLDYVKRHDIRNVRRLLELGIGPNLEQHILREEEIESLLDVAIVAAIQHQSSKILELLIEYGVDVSNEYLVKIDDIEQTINGKRIFSILRDEISGNLYKRLLSEEKKPLKDYDYLSGVAELRRLEGNIEGKPRTVYLLYDFHTVEGECPPKTENVILADYWVKRVLSEYKNIDVFLESIETEFKSRDIKKFFSLTETRARLSEVASLEQYITEDPLGRLIVDLYPCYGFDKSECLYTGNRVHFVDIRGISLKERITERARYNPVSALMELMRIFGNFKGRLFSRENITDYYFKNIKRSKITKQWEMGPFREEWEEMVKRYLEIFYERKIGKYEIARYSETIAKGLSKRLKRRGGGIVFKPRKGPVLEVVITNDDIRSFISYIFVPYMDIYFLGRFFKRFDVKGSSAPSYAENAIVYAGASHSDLYYRVLVDVIGFKETYRAKRYEKLQCLGIQDIPNPLFKMTYT